MVSSGRLFGGAFLLVAMLSLAQAGQYFHLLRQRILEQREERLLEEDHFLHLDQGVSLTKWDHFMENFIRQHLDHYNKKNQATFNQRYWVNAGFWRHGGPVFLFIGGEGRLSEYAVLKGHHVTLAEKYGALLLALEHRFYGGSLKPEMLEDDNLQYLSSQQALSDLVSFHQFISKKYKLTPNNTWICFGGSYPGSLAAWFRLKFPHLVFGAVASSAPVRAQLDFKGYHKVVAASLSNPVISGSKQCLDAVTEAFSAVEELVRSGQLDKLDQDFRSCLPLEGLKDSLWLIKNLVSMFMAIVQYNGERVEWANVGRICEIMTNHSAGSTYQRLVATNNIVLSAMRLKCLDNSYAAFIEKMTNPKFFSMNMVVRQWIFQTCTEFGYFQTCEDPACPFSRLVNLRFEMDVCKQVFNISDRSAQEAVSFTNEYYGANHPKASRVLFVNGDIDPWHVLSVLKDLSPSELAIVITGTSHCANMESPLPTDPLPLVEARKKITAQVGEWLVLARKTQQNN
uniref:Serine protease 16 n=1 Tax=Anolis carolinensis TaxID=28377 RepID=H9GHB0_ANOCA|nr:PREDICTED: thymus-specific serine protease [Anolis carolinensis]|eukprot:XP_003222903.1 PREDICTED: thymus-specific serine protease [Anolis carolinensis]